LRPTAASLRAAAAIRAGSCGPTGLPLAATVDGTPAAGIALALGRDRRGDGENAGEQDRGDRLSGHDREAPVHSIQLLRQMGGFVS
jgi:hypothetical protein